MYHDVKKMQWVYTVGGLNDAFSDEPNENDNKKVDPIQNEAPFGFGYPFAARS